MKIRIVRIDQKKWEPDRSRGKRFRTRPRRLRGKWALQIGTERRKAAPEKQIRNPIPLARLQKLLRLRKKGAEA